MLLFVVVDIVVCYCCCCCFLLLLMFSCCSYPRSGSSSNLENVFFFRRDENRRTWWKNPRSRKENKHQTQTTHIRTQLRDSNPGNIFGEPRALSALRPSRVPSLEAAQEITTIFQNLSCISRG